MKLLVDPERLAERGARAQRRGAGLEEDGSGAQRGRRLHAAGAGPSARCARRPTRWPREVAERRPRAGSQDWAIDAVTRPPQNRDLSGHEGEMLLNGAYLVETRSRRGLRELVAELEERHRALGARIELTGPWPPYNFVPGGDAGAVA